MKHKVVICFSRLLDIYLCQICPLISRNPHPIFFLKDNSTKTWMPVIYFVGSCMVNIWLDWLSLQSVLHVRIDISMI